MGISTRQEEIRLLFEQFYNLLDQSEWRKAEEILEELEL